MAISKYDVKDLVRVTALFKNAAGSLIDPTGTITFKFQDPSGNETPYTCVGGTSGVQIVRDSAGTYHLDIDIDEAGTWYYRAEATGTGQAADEQMFIADATVF